MELRQCQKAPDFELNDSEGNKVKLSGFKGKRVVLYFYPKDDTPGCTIQARQFTKNNPKLKKLKAVVLGVSPDGMESHEKFIRKYAINYTLLCDEDSKVAKKYGAFGEKSFMGRKFMGVIRSTFIIDGKGIIEKAFYKVNPLKSISEVLDFLEE